MRARSSPGTVSMSFAISCISATIAPSSCSDFALPDAAAPSVGSFSRVASMKGFTRFLSSGCGNRLRTSSRVYPTAKSRVVTGSLRLRSMRTLTTPFLSISSSTHEPRAGMRFAMKTCFSRSFGSIRYAPGERTNCVTMTRSVPLMMKVPQSVMSGRSPMKTFWRRISPVSLLTKETSIVSGAA